MNPFFKRLASLFFVVASVATTLALSAALTACDDDLTTQTPAPPPVVSGSATGVLTDSPIGGVGYATSSGVAGTTGSDGSYRYNPGDTVTFSLGALTLASVTATGVVSPFELAGGSDVKLQNLLVLLQSLDADGDPDDGISIPASAANAVTAGVDLAASTATFASPANTSLQAAMTAGGITTPIKTTAQANAHFIGQARLHFASNIWVALTTDANGRPVTEMLTLATDGSYSAPDTAQDAGGSDISGKEYGTYTVNGFNASGFDVRRVANPSTDLNTFGGLSNLRGCDRLRVLGDTLIRQGCGDRQTFVKMGNDPSGLTGAWAFSGETFGSLLFFANGRFLLEAQHIAGGTFALSAGTVTFHLDSGISFASGSTLSADGTLLLLGDAGDTTSFTRVSK